MQLFRYLIIMLACLCAAQVEAGVDPQPAAPDASTAGVDGPFVFYRNNELVVKTLAQVNEQLLYTSKVYDAKRPVRLSCKAEQTGDQFSFNIVGVHQTEPDVYPQPDKMLVVSDIEGNFEAFKMMLFGAGVVDKDFNWTFGNGHLILLGDFMDRGLDVTAVLWLAYKMDQESKLKGGKVHFILGNHEVMNLTGDTRYVRNKYFENARIIKENYKNWYKNDSELGRWLRSKNVMERIGDRVFCHAGLSPQLAYSGLTLNDINDKLRNHVSGGGNLASERSASIATSVTFGPHWYRGMVRQELKEHELQAIMGWAEAKQIIVGHTLVNDVQSLYDGRVIAIDLQHDVNLLEGKTEALWIDDTGVFVINHMGKKRRLHVGENQVNIIKEQRDDP